MRFRGSYIATGLWLLALTAFCSEKSEDIAGLVKEAQDARRRGEPQREAELLFKAGRLLNESGDRYGASEILQQSVLLRRSLKLPEEADALVELAESWQKLGNHRKAREAIQRALALFQRSNNQCGQARATFLWAIVDKPGETGSRTQAHANSYLRRSLALYEDCDDRVGRGDTLARLALNLYNSGDQAGSLLALERAQSDYAAAHDTRRLARLHYDRGLLHLLWMQESKPSSVDIARSSLRQAAQLFQDLGDREGYLRVLLAQGRIERIAGNTDRALELLKEAVQGVESTRDSIKDPELRRSYFAIKQDYHLHYIGALLDADRQDPSAGFGLQALETSESRRARSLLDSVHSAAQPGTVGIRSIQKLLEEETLLIEYSQVADTNVSGGRTGERLCAWLVTSDSVELRRTSVLRDVMRAAETMRRAQGHLSASGAGNRQFQMAARELSQMLLAPLGSLNRFKRIVIVPDAPLRLIPFAALPDPTTGRPLVETFEVVTLPSARLLAGMRQMRADTGPPSKQLAVFADPVFDQFDPRLPANQRKRRLPTPISSLERGGTTYPRLPFSRREAQAILSLVKAEERFIALDFEATRESVIRAGLDQYRLLHFATHGITDRVDHRRTGMALSMITSDGKPANGFLQSTDVAAIKLRADLVVLSGCQTGTGPELRGEGVLGLGFAFLSAGAKAVLSSLWKVDDQATAYFMTNFYTEMLGPKKHTPAQALRSAQIKMASHPAWNSPYHWAGFSLQGDWR